ncbi:hypothetical protein [Streptococcus dentiloxodontae]
MKVHFHSSWNLSKKHIITLSCAAALASFSLVAKPAFAEETASSAAETTELVTASANTTETVSSDDSVQAATSVTETANTEDSNQTVTYTVETAVSDDSNQAALSATETANAEESSQTATEADSDNQAPVTSGYTTAANQDNSTGAHYYSDEKGNWYYVDANGNNLTGAQTIDGVQVYFEANGVQVKGGLPATNTDYLQRYYDQDTGALWTNRYVQYKGKWYYVGANGEVLKGAQTINGDEVYFHSYHGFQIKGDFEGYFTEASTQGAYYDKDTGAKVTKAGWVQTIDGSYFYLDDKGEKLSGLQTIDGNLYYFLSSGASKRIRTGRLSKDYLAYFESNSKYARVYGYSPYANITQIYYFDAETGSAVKNRYVQYGNSWYYFGDDANAIIGEATINGDTVYFHKDGRQAKGELVTENGVTRYYDPDSGARVTNTTLTIKGVTYKFDEQGTATIV